MKNGKNAKRPPASQSQPDEFRPRVPGDLIGDAQHVARAQLARFRNGSHPARLRIVFYGDIGAGKTSIANMIAAQLAQNAIDVERVHGRNVTIELVRKWTLDAGYSSLFGGWKVKLINELDLVPPNAQDLMLDYLDELPAQTAVLATSNLDVATLTTRFQTRFQLVRVKAPSAIALEKWLKTRWRLPAHAAAFITLGACGNVRAALLDATSYLSTGALDERPKAPTANDWKKLRAAELREVRRRETRYPRPRRR